MSRTRFRTEQFEHGERRSPLHWSEQSDDSSDGDQDETGRVDRSPSPAIESQGYEAEDQIADVDYEHPATHGRNPYHEGSRSPVLRRRPIHQNDAATKEYIQSYEVLHPESSVSKLRKDRQPRYDTQHLPLQDLVIFILLLVIVSLVFKTFLFVSPSEESSQTSKDDLAVTVKNALSQYENISEDVAFQLSAGIRNIVESDPNKPSIFVILHNNTGGGPFCLANTIGNIAMKYLESEEKYPLILRPDELLQNEYMSQDYGWIIELYKPHIEKHRSVIVTDLQKLPGNMAMAFHFLCDTYSPVVPKSLFLFTLHVQNVVSKREVEQAENAMHNIWRDEVDNDKRQALITRLTEDIISLPLNILHNEACP